MQKVYSEQITTADSLLESFAARYPFALDEFQQEAMRHLAAGRSVLVTAPTGTGKTMVAEYAIWQALQQHKRVIYTTPLKALSNQKYQDFCQMYGSETVGLMTGDIVEHGRAQIVIMTTEVYRNMLLEEERERKAQRPSALSDIGFLIFDELHYISDPQRGPVWEEAIICSPAHIQIVGLSATVSNATDLVDWMSRVHGPTSLVVHNERAVPLEHFYLLDGQLHLVQNTEGQRVKRFRHIGGEAKRELARNRYARYGSAGRRQQKEEYEEGQRTPVQGQGTDQQEAEPVKKHAAPKPAEVLQTLKEAELLPCLYFLPGRKMVMEAAQQAASLSFTTPEEQTLIVAQLAQWKETLSKEDRQLFQVQLLSQLLPQGIGFHHAGLLPGLKLIVESLFAQGYLRAVFATDTLALGVNMPARAVVVGSLSKFDGQQMRLLTPNEYRQLTGRAGRRGLDTRGAAVIPYSPWETFEEAFAHITGPQLPVMSSFEIRYNSILNLWQPGDEDYIQQICASSLNEYQRAQRFQQKNKKRAEKQQSRKKQRKQKVSQNPYKQQHTDFIYPNLSAMGEAELRGTIQILRAFKFIDDETDTLTLKGHLLRHIYHPAGLTLIELITSGALQNCSPLELAEICSWFTFEKDRRFGNRFELGSHLKNIHLQLWDIEDEVHASEQEANVTLSPATMPDFHSLALAWGKGQSLSMIVEQIDLAEGDVLMLLNQTIDLLQQLQSAIGHVLDDKDLWDKELALSGYRHNNQRRKAERRLEAQHLILTQLRSKLSRATLSLMHGLVMQSRRLPSMAIRQEELPITSEVEPLADASWEETEESVQFGIIREAVTL
ncbi:hypothetical protein KDH_61140 [Dictyobacter sp. S3.2.2.5]|uniref:Helicase n=1 Tax=Dictyobacter halimunensis TaxID=3026934 RepID=A0ABQ6G060_9CHLR|nr:hypothetical protein KDH_61140 [Dictyobacter sp. S3.2.2.5]